MTDLHPYITNDGSVGLFSPEDNDIYHSSYGALSEAWEKFVLPSCLETRLKHNPEVKILDVCYGIGYNSKAAMQLYINLFLKNKSEKKSNFSEDKNTNIDAIYTNNISKKIKGIFLIFYKKFNTFINKSIDKIHSDNILDKNNHDESQKMFGKLFIDAVDTNDFLFLLSPFISSNAKKIKRNFSKIEKFDNEKYKQILEITKDNIKPVKEFQINDAINIILYKQGLSYQNLDKIKNNIQKILSENKFKDYFNKFMLNFDKFYSFQGYNYNKKQNKSAFVHNIYYSHVSTSNNLANLILKNDLISFNYSNIDARIAISSFNNLYDIIFLDAFTPSKCPALWSQDFFKLLHGRLQEDGVILTYSNSAAIRNAMVNCGLEVGKIIDPISKKCIGTIASKNIKNILTPLDEREIALMNSKAGICYKDSELNLTNDEIIANRAIMIKKSDLISSSQAIRGLKNARKDEV